MTDVTLGTVFCNGIHALQLMWRSYYYYNTDYPVKFWCWDNGSSDGAEKYAAKYASKTFVSEPGVSHGYGLDRICKNCTTEFVCIVDFDIEFKAPFMTKAVEILKNNPQALCVAYPTRQKMNNDLFPVGNLGMFNGVYRIDPCCVVFRTQLINHILNKFSFEAYLTYTSLPSKRLFYDVGAMIRQVAELANIPIIEQEWIWDAVNHYGGIGALVTGYKLDSESFKEINTKYETIKKQVSLYEEVPVDFGKA